MLTLESDGANGDTLVLRFQGGTDQRVSCGRGEWKKGLVQFPNLPVRPVAVSGAWASENTFLASLCYYETPYTLNLKLHFTDNQVAYDPEYNVFFGATKLTQLVGRSE